jgi:hypothetical protein
VFVRHFLIKIIFKQKNRRHYRIRFHTIQPAVTVCRYHPPLPYPHLQQTNHKQTHPYLHPPQTAPPLPQHPTNNPTPTYTPHKPPHTYPRPPPPTNHPTPYPEPPPPQNPPNPYPHPPHPHFAGTDSQTVLSLVTLHSRFTRTLHVSSSSHPRQSGANSQEVRSIVA